MSTGKIMKKMITTTKAPTPVAPYSQAVLVDRTLYISGSIGLDPKTQKFVDEDVVAQTKQAFINIRSILEETGSSLDKVVKTTVFLTNIDDASKVNEVYKQLFVTNFPARTLCQVTKLPLGAKVEIEAIAVTGEVQTI